MATVAALEPGDVNLSLEPRTRHAKSASSTERLSVATPVFSDITGKCFGMTVIETDVSRRIVEVLSRLGSIQCEIYVADGTGKLWASVDPTHGVRLAGPDQTIPHLPEQVASEMTKPGQPFELRRDDAYVAKRFYIDATGRGVLIFARLPDAD